jgi:hypothetical protein
MGKFASVLGVHLFHDSPYFERIASDFEPGSFLYPLLYNARHQRHACRYNEALTLSTGECARNLLSRVEANDGAFLLCHFHLGSFLFFLILITAILFEISTRLTHTCYFISVGHEERRYDATIHMRCGYCFAHDLSTMSCCAVTEG